MATIKTKRGQLIDIDTIRSKHEKEIAAGNMNVNARGDILGQNGEIIQKVEDRTKEYYTDNPNAVKKVSIKDSHDAESKEGIEELTPNEEAVEKPKVKRKPKAKKKPPAEIIDTKKKVVDNDQEPDGEIE